MKKLGLLPIILMLISCAPRPTPDLKATETAIAFAIFATLTAQAPSPTPTSVPTAAATTPAPTLTSTPTPKLSPTPLPDAVVTADALNLRAGPGTVYDRVGLLHKGDEVDVTARTTVGDWVQVVTTDGAEGWVSAAYVELFVSLDSIPVTTEIPPTPTVPISTPTSTPTSVPPTPTAICPILPEGGFLTIWQSNPELQTALGCPTSHHPRTTPVAWQVMTSYQPFERGEMIWSDHIGWYAQPVVYVLYANSTYQRFDDTFDPAVDPINGDETPPNGLVEPILGFGKVWREVPGVRDTLGWATADETPGLGRFQMFTGGNMVWISQTNQTYVFIEGIVHVFSIPFSQE